MEDFNIFNHTCLKNDNIYFIIQSDINIVDIKLYNEGNLIESVFVKTHRFYDYCIKICNNNISKIDILVNGNIELKNIELEFPFEDLFKDFDTNYNVITTMVKDYNHRLEEWINWNLNLGFDRIIIFDNSFNQNNSLNEAGGVKCNILNVTEKYHEKIIVIPFPYISLKGHFWNNIQRVSLTLGVSVLKNHCKHIATIDADEFIVINKKFKTIKDFLQKFNHNIVMGSNILTNKNDNDIINNNVLDIANYIGENKYYKVIINTKYISDCENYLDDIIFFVNPHSHPNSKKLPKSMIMHYHCWINERYKWKENLRYIKLTHPCIL